MARPVKPANPEAPTAIGLRVPGELKAALEKAAKAADRSLSQEAERRLRRSFEPDELIEDAIALADEHPKAERTIELGTKVLTVLYGKSAAELAAELAFAITIMRNLQSITSKDAKVRDLLVATCMYQLERVKEAIREVEAIDTEKAPLGIGALRRSER